MRDLALQIIKDGEGISKLITVHVEGAESDAAAKRIALSIANSPLVKTAIAGEDANWGRVVMAIGKAGEAADRDRLSIWFGDLLLAKNGDAQPGLQRGRRERIYEERRNRHPHRRRRRRTRPGDGLGLRPDAWLYRHQWQLPQLSGLWLRLGRHRSVRGCATIMTENEAALSPVAKLVLVAAVALIDADGRVLLAQRPEGKSMAGLWEFPGGKVEPGETPEAALIREIREELGIELRAPCIAPLTFASHAYETFHLLMPLFVCRRWEGDITAARRPDARLGARQAPCATIPMPPADLPLIPILQDWL